MVGDSRVFSVHRGLSWAHAGSRMGILYRHLLMLLLLRDAKEVGTRGPWEVHDQRAVSTGDTLGVLEQVGFFPEWMAF